jgi:hypothetical protein
VHTGADGFEAEVAGRNLAARAQVLDDPITPSEAEDPIAHPPMKCAVIGMFTASPQVPPGASAGTTGAHGATGAIRS